MNLVVESSTHVESLEPGKLDAAIRAAEEGLGVAIGVFPISNKKVRAERLTVLSGQFFPIEEAFYLVTPPNVYKRENYQILLSWLTEIFEDNKLHY